MKRLGLALISLRKNRFSGAPNSEELAGFTKDRKVLIDSLTVLLQHGNVVGIFTSVKSTRKTHRAKNHICHDIGFQMPTCSPICVEVELSSDAFVYLVNAQNYQNYFNGDDFRYYGGFANESPYAINIPSSGHWYVIIDNGDEALSVESTSTKIKSTGY